MIPTKEKVMNARKPVTGLLMVVLGIVALAGLGLGQGPMMTGSEARLRVTMRDAWDTHARWTQSYIVSSLAGLPDSSRVKSRLLESAGDVADALKPYYRDTIVVPLANLLKHYVLLTGAVVATARGGDSLATVAAYNNWSAGSDSVVQSLARTNPNWPDTRLGDLMRQYRDQTWRQVLARTRQDWMADVAACDQAQIEAQAIADLLSTGMVKQFPDKFK
jgi:hypothetical protein